MRKLGTIDFEVLQLAINEKGTFNETHLENSELKRNGVGKIRPGSAGTKVTFIHPKSLNGVLAELCSHP